MERFTFTKTADGSLTAPDATKAAVAMAFRTNPGTLSRDIVGAAADDLVRASKDLSFSSGKSYEECSRHLVSRDPWLALACVPIDDSGRSAEALGIEVVGP